MYALKIQSIRILLSRNRSGLCRTIAIISFWSSSSAMATLQRPAFSVLPVLSPLMWR